MKRRDTRIHGPNRFKLGLFSQNCSGGLTMTKAPEFWDPSWENNVAASRLAEAAGLEFLPPVARWHGYDDVVEQFRRMADVGLDGIAIGLVNFIGDMTGLRDEVPPRLERLGLRESRAGA